MVTDVGSGLMTTAGSRVFIVTELMLLEQRTGCSDADDSTLDFVLCTTVLRPGPQRTDDGALRFGTELLADGAILASMRRRSFVESL